jgi:hypothetical protein
MRQRNLTWDKKRNMCRLAYLGKEGFSTKSVVNLKNEREHILSESMMRKDLSGGG